MVVLRFNSVDGEDYGRGRVEEFLGDLKTLEGLSQALVEGSAAAAKVIFLVSPSSTPSQLLLQKLGTEPSSKGGQRMFRLSKLERLLIFLQLQIKHNR